MSLEAFIWAADLPLDLVNSTAYRVLIKLANHAHSDGRNAWRSKQSLAEDLGCDERTIQRALASLRGAGLIEEGDQALVSHLRKDRRPVVYDLMIGRARALQPELSTGSHGETNLSRGDRSGPHGETTVVALRTVIEPSIETTQGNQTGPVSPCPGSVTGHGPHQLGSYGKCVGCYEPWGMLS